jgi:hypothetical protein
MHRPKAWVLVVLAGCGTASVPSDDTTSSSSTSPSEGSQSSTTVAVTSMQDTSTGFGESSSVGTSSSESTSSGVDTGEIDCSTFATQDACEAAGCNVEHGEAFAWDSASGVCSSLGPTIVCHDSPGVLTAPGDYWRVVGDAIEVVLLNNMPFDLDGWERCGCRPGDPYACFGCGSSPTCGAAETCIDATDAEACAARHPSSGCTWVETTTYEADGAGCAVVESAGKCITGLPGKASCELVEAPQACAWTSESPPYVRSVDGGIELLAMPSCDAGPMGYMPCWSAGVGDPAACDCGC